MSDGPITRQPASPTPMNTRAAYSTHLLWASPEAMVATLQTTMHSANSRVRL